MIPPHWVRYERADDGELLGYLVPSAEDDTAAPVTVFGYSLGPISARNDAERRLDEVGLSYLADRWLLDVPDHGEPINVEIVEADPERLVVKNVDFGYHQDFGTRFTLDVPVTDGFRRG